jgi:hypothetical protein
LLRVGRFREARGHSSEAEELWRRYLAGVAERANLSDLARLRADLAEEELGLARSPAASPADRRARWRAARAWTEACQQVLDELRSRGRLTLEDERLATENARRLSAALDEAPSGRGAD